MYICAPARKKATSKLRIEKTISFYGAFWGKSEIFRTLHGQKNSQKQKMILKKREKIILIRHLPTLKWILGKALFWVYGRVAKGLDRLGVEVAVVQKRGASEQFPSCHEIFGVK